MLPHPRSYAFWLGLFRICVGGFWLAHAVPKFTNQAMFMPPDGAIAKIVAMGSTATTGPYHDFLMNVITPNIELFAQLVRLGEALVGITLVLGFLTRLGGLGGMFLSANYMLAKGTFGSLDGWSGLDGAAFLMSALNFVLPTGRTLGFDWFLGRPRYAPMPPPVPTVPTVVTPGGTPIHTEFVEDQPVDPNIPPR